MQLDYEAFWSYTHEDDKRMSGYVTRLAQRIGDEYAVSSGNDLKIFRDRESIQWGDAWRSKIDGALGAAPFFIAIITPKFVKSEECRRELLTFVAESKSRGFSKLLLPILLIDVPDLKEDSEDEVLALLARTQYVNWTKHRLRGESDPAVLEALNEVALRIMQLANDAQEDLRQVEQEIEQDGKVTVETIFGEIESSLPAWSDAVDFDPVAAAQWNAAWRTRSDRAQRLYAQHRGVSGAFISIWTKLGIDLMELSENRLKKAKTYHRATIALDPHITAAIRLVERDHELAPLLDTFRDGIDEAMRSITNADGEGGWHFDLAPTKYSSKLQQATDNVEKSGIFVREANMIVGKWSEQLHGIDEKMSVTRPTNVVMPLIEPVPGTST
ncbi:MULTISPECIES: toll/interleukin-1 receptor domain-containing protein [unclassified Arthrobacter]|uniref:toll/interleukin-1 receptor domain-containing protein n=1 Tax=unclassified Arthrobacter TaxID=235627 RepID=UPI0015E20A35|nr:MULTISPECIES: toll/interleukin-1 receptor domain-containing protein [unclassified Arthrobacter]